MKDSVSNAENKKLGIKQQLKYEYENKSAADSIQNAEKQKVTGQFRARRGAGRWKKKSAPRCTGLTHQNKTKNQLLSVSGETQL